MGKSNVLERSEVLKRIGLSIHSLRYYVKFFRGIIPGCVLQEALKGGRGSRAFYPEETVDLINGIRKQREKGKKLAEIRIALQAEKARDEEFKKRGRKRDGRIPTIVRISNPDFKAKVFIGEGEMEKGLTECLGKPEIIVMKNGKRIMRWRG